MEEYIIDISDYSEEITILERAFFELKARENIINLMIIEGFKEHPNYKLYWDEYLEYLKVYQLLQQDFYNKHLTEYDSKWKINFDTETAVVYYKNTKE